MTVTDEDREAAASIAVLVEMRELILAGRADHHAEPFAAHREAAYIAGLERAAEIANMHDTGDMTREDMEARRIVAKIRAEIDRAKSPEE